MNRRPDTQLLEYRRDAVARLTQAGCSATEIAVRLGVTRRTVQRHREITGASRDRDLYPPMTASELAIARALLEDGASYGEVARTLHRGACTIGRHFPGYGWSVGSGGEYRRAMQLLDSLRPVLPVAGIAS